MDATDFVLLALHEMGGQIQGRTKLQKMIYFLGVITDSLDLLAYRPHFYGPYSHQVVDAMNRLKAIGVVNESQADYGAESGTGFEVHRYDFDLTEEGRIFAKIRREELAGQAVPIAEAVKKLREVGEADYVKLAIAAKTYFMLGQRRGHASDSELAALAPRFGWNVTTEQVRDAGRYLNTLGLVEISAN